MKLSTAKVNSQTLVVLAVVVILLFLGGGVVYLVCAQQLDAATKSLQAKGKLVDDNKKVAGRLESAERQFRETQLELGFLETSVTTYDYVPTLLKQLEQLGKSMDLRVLSVRPQPAPVVEPPPIKRTSEDPQAAPELSSKNGAGGGKAKTAEEAKPYEQIRIDIEVEGTYWNVRNFVRGLTRFPKIIAVNAVQIAPAGIALGRASPRLQVQLSTTAFIFPSKEPPEQNGEQQGPATTTQTQTQRRFTNEG